MKLNSNNLFFNVLNNSSNKELASVLKNIEFLNIDLKGRQITLLENYSHYMVNKLRHKPVIKFKLGSHAFNKSFDYYNDLCKKNFLKRDFKIISTRKKKITPNFNIDFSYQLDLWQENACDKQLNHIEFKKLIFFYTFSIKNYKALITEEYWNLYVFRLDLELQKKKLKKQKAAMVDFHLRKNTKFINYHELLQMLIDFKLQLNIFKQNIIVYQKKTDNFIKKNSLQFYNKNIKKLLFNFSGLNLKSVWKLFITAKNLRQFKNTYFLVKDNYKKNFEFNILKKCLSLKKALVKKLPHVDCMFNLEREYADDRITITNGKNKLTRFISNPKDGIYFGVRLFLNIFDNFFSLNERFFYQNKINSLIDEYNHKLFSDISEFRFITKKLKLIETEIYTIKQKLLVSTKALFFFKKINVIKFRDFEIVCFQNSLTLKKKIFEYLKLNYFLYLNS